VRWCAYAPSTARWCGGVSEAPIQGTVVLEGTWWEAPAPDGKGINWLTGEHLTDMGEGSTFHSNPVRLEALD